MAKQMGLSLPYHCLDLSLSRSHFLTSLSIPCYRSGGDDPHHHDDITNLLECCIDGLLDELRKIEKADFPLSVTFLDYVLNWLREEEKKYREEEEEEKCRDKETAVFDGNSDGRRGTESQSNHHDKEDWLQLWGYSFNPPPPPLPPPPSKPSTSLLPMDPPEIHITAPPKWIHTPCRQPSCSTCPGTDSIKVAVANGRTSASTVPRAIGAAGRTLNKTVIPYLAARKQRRCWSNELHQKFTDALEKLGGSQVATPKQIRELMGVDGLTNDEVKSHLQKYRLHLHRSPSHTSSNGISHKLLLHRDIASKAGSSNSLSPDSPLQFAMATTNCNTSATSGESSMVEDQEIVWPEIKGEPMM